MNEGVIFEALKKLDCIKDECVGDLSTSCGCYQVLRALRDAERARCAAVADEIVKDCQKKAASAGGGSLGQINAAIEVTAMTIATQIRTGV